MSNSQKGKKHSLKTKRKMSIAHKGMKCKNHTDETKRKISEALKGKTGENSTRWKGGKKAKYERQKKDLKYRLNCRMKTGIRQSLKFGSKNGRSWESLVPYNYKQLKRRLDFTMPNGYTWQDFLNGDLHIDHIIPISAFNFDESEHLDFSKCWALSNLQLLPAKENISKGKKLYVTIQPSLRL